MSKIKNGKRGRRFRSVNIFVCFSFFLPYSASLILSSSPSIAWWLAWVGSLWIGFAVWFGLVGGHDYKVPLSQKILRPTYLIHVIFAGYGFVSSIFYFFDLSGIRPIGVTQTLRSESETLAILASAQQYYVLAHASLVCGMLAFSRRFKHGKKWSVPPGVPPAKILIIIAGLSAIGTVVCGFLPGLSQISEKLQQVCVVASAISLGHCLTISGRHWLPLSICINAILFVFAISSGWKEEVIVLIILVSISIHFRYPTLGKIIGVSIFSLGVLVLPTITHTTRDFAWSGNTSSIKLTRIDIANAGVDALLRTSVREFTENTWRFLTDRISEASMFTKYIESVRNSGVREGVEILKQAAFTPIPRIIWPNKPNMEELVKIRVLNHGAVSPDSFVSAKPHIVVDAFLVGGALGITLIFFVLGGFSVMAFDLCERLLGGYLIGGVFFNGLFSILWQGACLEFLVNALFWSLILMFFINWLAVKIGFLLPHQYKPKKVRA